MKREQFLYYGHLVLLVLVLLDALYFILKPVEVFSSAQGKLFGTMMYRKSSLLFEVVNGANYTLSFNWIVLLLWFVTGLLYGIVPTLTSQSDIKWHLSFALLLPPLTWDLILIFERFYYLNIVAILVCIGILSVFVISQAIIIWLIRTSFNMDLDRWKTILARLTSIVLSILLILVNLVVFVGIGVNQ